MIKWDDAIGGYVDAPSIAPLHDDCVHAGDQTRLIEAGCCGGRTRIKIMACTIYEECSAIHSPDVQHCGSCKDYVRRV